MSNKKNVHENFKIQITCTYLLVAAGSSGILKGKQKLGVTFNFDKQDVIGFMKISKMTMRRVSEANQKNLRYIRDF